MINFDTLYTISDEVTSAILVYRNNEMCDGHIGTTDQSVGLQLFPYVNTLFCFKKLT